MIYLFLVILGLVYLLVASISDIKKREVPNWLSFSLVVFALGYRLIYSLLNYDFMFFVYGLFGFFMFTMLAYVFYYSRVFAAGDFKLFIGLGAVVVLSSSFVGNLILSGIFIFLIFLAGGIYGLGYSIILALIDIKNFNKEFKKQFKLKKSLFVMSFALVVLSLIFAFLIGDRIYLFFPLIFFIMPFLFVFGKTVEELHMVKDIDSNKIEIGDWLYEKVEIKVNGRKKTINPYWEGLSEKEVDLLRKYGKKKIKIKQGIPFVPSFLVAFLVLVYFLSRNSSWGFFKLFWFS